MWIWARRPPRGGNASRNHRRRHIVTRPMALASFATSLGPLYVFLGFIVAAALMYRVKQSGDGIGLWVLLAALTARQLSIYHVFVPHTTSTNDLPLYSLHGDDTYGLHAHVPDLLQGVREHSNAQSLNPGAFGRTSGFVLRFNRDGASTLRDPHSRFAFLAPFFDAVAENESNAFVLNALVIEATPPGESRPSVGAHLDDTVGIDAAKTYLAHTVTVFYLQVPDGVRGGHLELFSEGVVDPEATPQEAIAPVSSTRRRRHRRLSRPVRWLVGSDGDPRQPTLVTDLPLPSTCRRRAHGAQLQRQRDASSLGDALDGRCRRRQQRVGDGR
eukprot:6202556-Prymnesium_polylepis.1